jgi:hypothetical protein
MKIVMLMKWDGVTADQYEKLRKVVNWEGNEPKGAVFHVATFDNAGIRVTDIWESADDFNNFVQSRLMPGTAEVGIAGSPQVEVYPAHAIYAPHPDRLKL